MNDRDDFDFPRGGLNEGEPKFLKLADALWDVMCEHAPGMPAADMFKCIKYIRSELDNVFAPSGDAELERMTESERMSLRAVIRFFWRDEQRHFEDMEVAGDDTGDHIFRHLVTLDRYTREQSANLVNL